MAHDISEAWIDLYHETEAQFYAISLIITTFLLNIGSITAAIFLYVLYPDDTKTLTVTTVTLVVGLFQTLVSIWPFVQSFNPRSGILQPSFVTFYNMYLITSATVLNQKPPSFEAYSGAENPWLLYTGLTMTFISLGYSAMNSGVKSSQLTFKDTIVMPDVEVGGDSDSSSGPLLFSSTSKTESDTNYCYNYSFFHFIFILAACYAALVLTGWKRPGFEETSFFTVPTVAAYWMRICSSWTVSFLYLFTVFAPKLFPDRDFGFD